MAKFKLKYNCSPDSWIAIQNVDSLSIEQQKKLVEIIKDSIYDSWEYNEKYIDFEYCECEDYTTEKDNEDIILSMCFEILFITEVGGYYDPGKTYGPIENCYPPEIEFEDIEIYFNEKRCLDFIKDEIMKEEALKDLDIDVDGMCLDCNSFYECSDYEILDEYE